MNQEEHEEMNTNRDTVLIGIAQKLKFKSETGIPNFDWIGLFPAIRPEEVIAHIAYWKLQGRLFYVMSTNRGPADLSLTEKGVVLARELQRKHGATPAK